MMPSRIGSPRGGIRRSPVNRTVGEAPSRAWAGSSASTSGIPTGGLVLLDQIVERHVQGSRHLPRDRGTEREKERKRERENEGGKSNIWFLGFLAAGERPLEDRRCSHG